MNLVLASGDEEDVFAALGEGLYLPCFHYLGLVDPATATFTGTIRDAAWVEGGRLVGKYLRPIYHQLLALADRIEVLGKKRWLVPGDWEVTWCLNLWQMALTLNRRRRSGFISRP